MKILGINFNFNKTEKMNDIEKKVENIDLRLSKIESELVDIKTDLKILLREKK